MALIDRHTIYEFVTDVTITLRKCLNTSSKAINSLILNSTWTFSTKISENIYNMLGHQDDF